MNEWIDVLEKLPKSEEIVLVTLREGTDIYGDGGKTSENRVNIAMFYDKPEHSGKWFPFFCVLENQNKEFTDEVIAWMPLPEPYQG